MCDEFKRILYLGKTKPGSIHDFKIFKKETISNSIPDLVGHWVDKGFDGIKNLLPSASIVIAHKRRRGSDLTNEQKEENKIISSLRVVNEHAIGGIKKFGSLSQKYRNKGNLIADTFINVAAGLWNLQILLNTIP